MLFFLCFSSGSVTSYDILFFKCFSSSVSSFHMQSFVYCCLEIYVLPCYYVSYIVFLYF